MADLTLIPENGTGLATANSFVTLEEAADILERRGHSQAWQEGDDFERQRALLTAFDLLTPLAWMGSPTTATQAGAWPRTGVRNQFGSDLLPDSSVPYVIKQGQVWLARRLKQKDLLELADQVAVTSSSSGGKSRAFQSGHPARSIIPTEVWVVIGLYVNLTTARLVRAA